MMAIISGIYVMTVAELREAIALFESGAFVYIMPRDGDPNDDYGTLQVNQCETENEPNAVVFDLVKG